MIVVIFISPGAPLLPLTAITAYIDSSHYRIN